MSTENNNQNNNQNSRRKSRAKYSVEERNIIKRENLKKGWKLVKKGTTSGTTAGTTSGTKNPHSPRCEFVNAINIHDFEDYENWESGQIYINAEISEKMLMRAVIYRAIIDACQDGAWLEAKIRREAREWLESDSTKICSYNWCCDMLNVGDYARNLLRNVHKTQGGKRMLAAQRSSMR